MPQFTVHRNENRETLVNCPLLLDVQSKLLAAHGFNRLMRIA